jgi:hypothetical protein
VEKPDRTEGSAGQCRRCAGEAAHGEDRMRPFGAEMATGFASRPQGGHEEFKEISSLEPNHGKRQHIHPDDAANSLLIDFFGGDAQGDITPFLREFLGDRQPWKQMATSTAAGDGDMQVGGGGYHD